MKQLAFKLALSSHRRHTARDRFIHQFTLTRKIPFGARRNGGIVVDTHDRTMYILASFDQRSFMHTRMLAAAVLCAAATVGHGQAPIRDSIITVNAQRTTHIRPDRSSFYVVIEGVAETAPDAVARVQVKLPLITDAIRRADPQARVDRPVSYSVGATPNMNGYPAPAVPMTQTARSVVHVELERPDQVGAVMAAAIAAGAAHATGLTFELANVDSVRRARVPEAIAAGRADAESIAAALHGRLGALVDVSVSGNSPVSPFSTTQLSFDNRFPQPSQAPDLMVTTAVTLRYRLVP